jgi:hypothetical protein
MSHHSSRISSNRRPQIWDRFRQGAVFGIGRATRRRALELTPSPSLDVASATVERGHVPFTEEIPEEIPLAHDHRRPLRADECPLRGKEIGKKSHWPTIIVVRPRRFNIVLSYGGDELPESIVLDIIDEVAVELLEISNKTQQH